jgi:hypothetical protein
VPFFFWLLVWLFSLPNCQSEKKKDNQKSFVSPH